jgi:glycosyltransferase involved in cell wall biosynthesis
LVLTEAVNVPLQHKKVQAASGGDVVLVYTSSTWADAYRRGMCRAPDRLYQTLASEDRVRRLMVADPFRSLPIRAARRMLNGPGPSFPTTDTRRLCRPTRLRRRDPRGLGAIERAYRVYDRALSRAAKRANLEWPSVIVLNPLAAAFSPFEWANRVVLYLNDDWAELPQYRRWWPEIEEAYARFAASGQALCAVTQAIVDRVAPSGPASLMPNGVEPTEWCTLAVPPRWFGDLPAPRGLYLGTVDGRLDLDAVASAARALAGGTLILAGPSGHGLDLARLTSIPGVHLHAPISRSEVPALVSAADVCVLPHARTALTQAMSPLKAYEYLAGGRPVVATDLEPLRNISPRISLVSRSDDFGEAVARALQQGPQPEAERRVFLEGHAWRRRHEAILRLALD